MKKILITLSILLPMVASAATTDFTADGNITISSVTFDLTTADMIIMNQSVAESWDFSSGTFTVTNPGSYFEVGSADAAVITLQVTSGGATVACTENATPGTSKVTLPTDSGVYTIVPSTTATCLSLCPSLSNVATYNSFPTCGALTCSAGYSVSGFGSSATCIASGGPVGGGGGGRSIARTAPVTPAQAALAAAAALTVNKPLAVGSVGSFSFNLSPGHTSNDVKRLQTFLAQNKDLYPEGMVTGYFGNLTKAAVGRFQLKYGILQTSKDLGYGNFGPRTRAKLNELSK